MFTLSTNIVPFLVLALGGRPGHIRTEAARRLQGNRAISMQQPCILRSLRMDIVRSPYSFRAKVARRRRGDRAAAVTFLSVFCLQVHQKIVSLLHDQRESSVRCPCGDCAMTPTTYLRANNFLNLYKLVNPYENLTAASCLRTEAVRKRGYGQDTGSVD